MKTTPFCLAILILSLTCGNSLSAAEAKPKVNSAPEVETQEAPPVIAAPAEAAPVPEVWPMRRLKLQAGVVTDNPDVYITDSAWQLQSSKSYQISAGFFVNFPRAWKVVRFFAGPELKYMSVVSELGNSSLQSTYNQAFAVAGAEFRPFWARPFGFSAATAFQLWGEKRTRLKTPAFTQDLGLAPARDEFFLGNLLPDTELAVFWEVSPRWKPALTWDIKRKGSSLTVGVDYVF